MQAARRGPLIQRPVSGSVNLPAPTGGWNARDPLSLMKPEDAVILENWVPRTADITTRKGAAEHLTGVVGRVRTLASYHSGTVDQLFACTDAGIFDATAAGEVGTALNR